MADKHFIDWESETFGYGYGTGEVHTLNALKRFFNSIPHDGNYDYERMESSVGIEQFWLLLNTLCHADIIEYGTSPRYGWLSTKGKQLKKYIDTKSVDDLYEMVSVNEDYTHCYKSHCNCDTPCNNPLF